MGKKLPLATALVAGLLLSACGKTSTTSTAKTTFNLMESDTIATFDQSASTTVPIWDVLNQMDDGLFRSDKNNNPVYVTTIVNELGVAKGLLSDAAETYNSGSNKIFRYNDDFTVKDRTPINSQRNGAT